MADGDEYGYSENCAPGDAEAYADAIHADVRCVHATRGKRHDLGEQQPLLVFLLHALSRSTRLGLDYLGSL